MKIIEIYKISSTQNLILVIPDEETKENLYYQPSEQLNKFDLVQMLLQNTSNIIVLADDIISEILIVFRNTLLNLLSNKAELPLHLKPGEIGLLFNKETYHDLHEDTSSQYWLWSTKKIQTWAYSKNSKIYLEISSSYPWLFVDPKPGEDDFSFESFIQDYKPLAFLEIEKKTAKTWLDKCEDLLKFLN